MITISESLYGVISAVLIAFYILMFFLGYRKGIIRALIDLVGTVAAVWIAWMAAPAISDFAHVWPREWVPMQDTVMAGAVYQFVNELVLFIILFVLMKVMIALLENIARGIDMVPGIHFVSSLLGGVFQLAVAVLWTLIFCVILGLPVFTNGTDAVNRTLIGTVRDAAGAVSSSYIAPFMDSDAFGEFFENTGNLPEESRDAIRQWLKDHGYDEKHIDEAVPEAADSLKDAESLEPSSSAEAAG